MLRSIVEAVEAGIAVGLQDAAEAVQVLTRMLTLAIRGVAKPYRRRIGAARGSIITHVDPQPPLLGLASARCQHRHRAIVDVELLGREHVPAQRLNEWLHQGTGRPDPLGECRAIQLDAVSGIDLALAIKRQMIAILGHQHVCQESGTCHTARDGARGCWRLDDLLTAGAAVLGPHMPDHLPVLRHVLEHLGDILTERAQHPAALRTATRGRRLMHHALARQALRQWPAYALAALSGRRRWHGQTGLLTLELFELELQLPDLLVKLFRGAAKMHPPQPCDLQLQLLDLVLTRQQESLGYFEGRGALKHQSLKCLDVVRQLTCARHAAL